MRLTELEPQWVLYSGDPKTRRRLKGAAKGKANGILFVCPKCFEANGRKRPGVHSVLCWDPTVPQTVFPVPGRWELVGTCFDDLTLRAGSSSVLLLGGCAAHFFITNGAIAMTP